MRDERISMFALPTDDPLAVAAVEAIRGGDVTALRRLLTEHPDLATVRLGNDADHSGNCGESRTLLHVLTDWPGHFPNGAARVAVLVTAGVSRHR